MVFFSLALFRNGDLLISVKETCFWLKAKVVFIIEILRADDLSDNKKMRVTLVFFYKI